MSDEVDFANERRDVELAARIAEMQYQLGHAVNAFELGRCRNCNEKLDDGRAFCDASCRQDFEDRLAADRRNGKYRGG